MTRSSNPIPEASPTGLPGIPAAGAEPAGDTEKTMSLMAGVVRSDDADAGLGLDEARPPGKLLNKGSLLILGLFVAAAGMLYAMRARPNVGDGVAFNQAAEAKIDNALVRTTMGGGSANDPMSPVSLTALFGDTESIVQRFSADPTARQVPIEQVKKNPFVLPVYQEAPAPAGSPTTAPAVAQGGVRPKPQPKVDETAKLTSELETLKLTSVMTGRTRVAVINGQFLQEGQKIGSFSVKSITSTGVTLFAAGKSFTLSMDEKPGPPSVRGK